MKDYYGVEVTPTTSDPDMHDVFVYGSLLSGLHNSVRIRESAERHPANVQGSLYDTGHGFPMMFIEGKTDGTVYGEVVTVDSDTLNELDILEGHPNIYRRKLVEAYVAYGNVSMTKNVWCYVRERPCSTAGRIDSGDWKSFVLGGKRHDVNSISPEES